MTTYAKVTTPIRECLTLRRPSKRCQRSFAPALCRGRLPRFLCEFLQRVSFGLTDPLASFSCYPPLNRTLCYPKIFGGICSVEATSLVESIRSEQQSSNVRSRSPG